MKICKSLSIALLLAGMVSTTAVAQSYYDDDIYYDASKDVRKKKDVVKSQTTGNTEYRNSGTSSPYQYLTATDGTVYVVDEQGNAYPVRAQDIPGSDLYTVYTDNTRDVDEYNRRYQNVDSISVDSLYRDTFANTRMIERFNNPNIVSESNDRQLIDYYAATQPAQINIYVDTPAYYGWNILNPYYYRPYSYWNSWGWGWDPWYRPGWYDPYYSWSWGWGPSWSWGPGWHPGYVPVRPHRPISPGAHRPAYPGSNVAHSPNGGYRGNATSRPGGSQGGYRGSAGSRPSVGNVNSLGTTRPATNYNKGTRPSGSRYNGAGGTRNSGVSNGGNRSGGRGNAVNNNSNNNRSNTPS
ncbi:MAG: hypothetical protein K2G06_04855 [Muribaculaceae bacterium]|nr:hypothetical protein [Muribaculaceae bacterium]